MNEENIIEEKIDEQIKEQTIDEPTKVQDNNLEDKIAK